MNAQAREIAQIYRDYARKLDDCYTITIASMTLAKLPDSGGK
jgi:hypothetical protein